MSTLKKWRKMQNSYNQKHIKWMLDRYPELQNEAYVITEKIDGSNMSWTFHPNAQGDNKLKFASRRRYIGLDEKFCKTPIAEMMDADAELLDMLAKKASDMDAVINLYGEIFGPGIQNRVNYGDKRRILYFGMAISGKFIPWGSFQMIVPAYRTVPVVDTVFGLDKALEVSEDFVTQLNPEGGSKAEGIVISVLDRMYTDGHGRPFMLKKKAKDFEEVKAKKERKELPPELVAAQDDFNSYITRNRLLSVISQLGDIEEPSQMGTYIKAMLNDAREDYTGSTINGYDKQAGKICARLLKEHMANG